MTQTQPATGLLLPADADRPVQRIQVWPGDTRAMLHALEPLDPESEESPRRGLYVAFERVGLGWRWRCLHCGAAGTGHTDELALAAAIAHPCASEEVQA